MSTSTSTYDRGQAIADQLSRAGVRATTDPGAATPPCILVMPPDRTYDLACGFTCRWTLVAIAAAALGANRQTWADLDDLLGAIARIVPVSDAEAVSYQLNGQSYPAYLAHFEEAS